MVISRGVIFLPIIFFIALATAAAFVLPPQNVRVVCASGRAHFDGCAGAGQESAANAPFDAGVISLWGGARESIALKADGTVWTWGINNCILGNGSCGKLGDGTILERDVPVEVHGPGDVGYLQNITAIMGGEHHNYALKDDGTVWAWGGNFFGQLGDGTWTNTTTPVQVSGLTSVKSLGGRGYHSLAVKTDGTVWAWGYNSRGQLGHATSGCGSMSANCSNVPVQVIGITNVLTVTGGGFFSLALMSDHTVTGWGANEHGQLGNGNMTDQPSPVQASSVLSNVVQVSGGWKHAVALTSDGTVWTWGDNTEGEIGNGITSTVGISVPLQVPGLDHVVEVSAGDRFTAALKDDGTVWTWGWNGFGQLGNGTETDSASPVQVHNLSNVDLMAARDYHDLARKTDGTVWAWGSGGNGELGDNHPVDSSLPVQVLFGAAPNTPTPTNTPTATATVGATATQTATPTPLTGPVTDLQVTKTGKRVSATQHKYKVKVKNIGGNAAADVQVTDKVRNQYTIERVRAPGWVCETVGREITCTRAVLDVGAMMKVIVVVTTNSNTGRNCAGVSTSTSELNLGNNRACARVR